MKNKQIHGMVDVGGKSVTKRTAKATATIKLSTQSYKILMDGQSPKGDVFEVAKVAAVMAVKSTPSLIPLCHPLEISKVSVSFKPDKVKKTMAVIVEVGYAGRTGVEMEALAGVSAAALTIYDMLKFSDKAIMITDIMLLSKKGGKSGDFKRK